MTKILVVSDDGVATGYGRISMEVNTRLVKRGYNVYAASLPYDGLMPPNYEGAPLPYWVASLNGKNWVEAVMGVTHAYQPDVIICCQDMPYAEALRNAPLDWSRYGFIVITPVDGAPVFPRWIDLLKQADGTLSISEFGVKTHRMAGVASELCRPGVDGNKFFKLPDDQRAELRARLGIAPGAFVLGSMCMNQGRKAIYHMVKGFFAFAADKPDARYLMDMEAVSPAGWDIPALCQNFGWDVSKLIFRADCLRAGLVELRERYNVLDAHVVLAHREGYGLPLAEAMACGVVSMALDYCSGREICGDGRGVLIKPLDYTNASTWGNALDYHPDVNDFAAQLERLYAHPHERAAIAERGMAWARLTTWDAAADNVQMVIERVMAKRAALPPANVPLHAITPPEAPVAVVEPTPMVTPGVNYPTWAIDANIGAMVAAESVQAAVYADGAQPAEVLE